MRVLTGVGMPEARSWPLGELPVAIGKHELAVTLPTGLPPTCAQFAEPR